MKGFVLIELNSAYEIFKLIKKKKVQAGSRQKKNH